MAQANVLGTERIGQLTGSTDPTIEPGRPRPWPNSVDWQGWPLLQDTGKWGVAGVDLGANTEHSDGRLYFFFGDVATSRGSHNLLNTDLVAWTDDTTILRHGGHLAQGWNFILPNDHQGGTTATGQPDWRFCGKCHGLFFAPQGNPANTVCPTDGGTHQPLGWNFILPNDRQGATPAAGQPDWRFCGKCHGLFFAPQGNPAGTVCPKDGAPHSPQGWNFVLPNDHQGATAATGQPDWHFCANCHGLFWNGDGLQGVCRAARGGGFRLHPVLNNHGEFDPFVAQEPIRETLSNETPNGAFSHNGKAYVFVGFAAQYWRGRGEQPRPGDPSPGCYLVSKNRPEAPSNPDAKPVPPIPPNAYRKHFLFSPRIGWCPDHTRSRLECHEILGLKFALPHDVPETPTRQANWRLCHKCGAMFWNGGPNRGHCHRGGSHEAAPTSPNYCLPHDIGEDAGNQGNWRFCGRCASLFWNGDPNGFCPAGGNHQVPVGSFKFVLPNDLVEDATTQSYWRFCGKCHGMFFDGDNASKGTCPKDEKPHEAIGLTFVLRHDINEDPQNQKNWAFCGQCSGMFWNGDAHGFKGVCPKGGSHTAPRGSFNFVLRHDVNDDPRTQKNWAFCSKCAGLFFDGFADKGVCPKGGGHSAPPGSFNFVLPHNPGAETEPDWRFCTKCAGMVKTGQEDIFTWAAPVVVNTADHPELPNSPNPQSLVIFGFGYSSEPGIRLAWMPLQPGVDPNLQDVLYYTGRGTSPWSSEIADAVVLMPHANNYSHVSAAWLAGPKRWIVLYGTAIDNAGDSAFRLPAMARIGTSLFPITNWTTEKEIFNPTTAGAYTHYMHEPRRDTINPDVPPMEPPPQDHPGWAYGVFILNRFTEWNASASELGIHYLMSTSSPYQVHLMHTRFHID
jgi:uncharacterized protein with PIN domain